jgi:SAM-dependent methyltransferase
MTSALSPTRAEYDAAARDYDRRWRRYNERSLALLRPWVEGRALGRVLDVGCGTGNLLPRLAAWGASVERYAGADPSTGMLRGAAAKSAAAPFAAAQVAASAGALPFSGGAFDTVLSASSLHYWPDAAAGLRELRRVLAPGGTLLLVDWDRGPLRMRLLDRWMRLRGVRYATMYDVERVRALLRDAGFLARREACGRAGWPWALFAVEAS